MILPMGDVNAWTISPFRGTASMLAMLGEVLPVGMACDDVAEDAGPHDAG
jgi:hypothetical protein